ncbi:MAG: MarR family transcriptional regulator [Ruminococcus sp.]|nr:MarR family transcriptional regulator [Ruminococcus sp.]
MADKDIGRHLAELNNLIHREIIRSSIQNNPLCNEEDKSISGASSCIISYLYDHNDTDVFQKDLEQEFSVRRSTMSKVLTLLEQKGYIKREAVDSDKRLKKIAITQKTVLVADKLKAHRTQLEEKMVKGISIDELTQFKKTLEKIKQNLKEAEKA